MEFQNEFWKVLYRGVKVTAQVHSVTLVYLCSEVSFKKKKSLLKAEGCDVVQVDVSAKITRQLITFLSSILPSIIFF